MGAGSPDGHCLVDVADEARAIAIAARFLDFDAVGM